MLDTQSRLGAWSLMFIKASVSDGEYQCSAANGGGRRRLRGTNGADAHRQAQPDYSGMGQLSSARLLRGCLLERGPGHPLSTVTLGQREPTRISPTDG